MPISINLLVSMSNFVSEKADSFSNGYKEYLGHLFGDVVIFAEGWHSNAKSGINNWTSAFRIRFRLDSSLGIGVGLDLLSLAAVGTVVFKLYFASN